MMMADVGFWDGIARSLAGRGMFGGTFQLRLILQPLAALLLGIRFGLRDARKGKEPFFMSVVHAKHGRWSAVGRGLRDAIVPLCVALVVDGILQRMLLGRVRPLAAVVVGTLLVFVPFAVARGVSNRIWTRRSASGRS